MGDKIFFPNSAQFDTMNENLAKIAGVLGSQMDVSTWKGVQKAVRAGVAPELFPIGTQLMVSHSVYGKHLYDVVAHNYFKSAHDKNAPTMTLMCHDMIASIQYDAPEALWSGSITSDHYTFDIDTTIGSWERGTYLFVVDDFHGEGTLIVDGDITSPLDTLTVTVYDSDNVARRTYSITRSTEKYTHLGSLGKELNHPHRITYGSNNYKESAIRQFLNSSAEAGKVWKPQTKFDLKPSWADNLAGFANGLDEEFLSCVGEVIVPCSANNTYEAPDSTTIKGEKYTVVDKFYLASQGEIFGTKANSVDDGSVLFPYYDRATNADYIKYKDDGSPVTWWTRTANTWSSYVEHTVRSDGTLQHGSPMYYVGCVPVCTIV